MPVYKIVREIYHHEKVVAVRQHPIPQKLFKLLEEVAILMLFAGGISFAWVNLFPTSHDSVVHANILGLSFKHWVNGWIMMIFFALAGIELSKARNKNGTLENMRKAALPLLATLGGILIPMAVFGMLAFLLGLTDLIKGAPVPSATDIAFVFAVILLVAPDFRALKENGMTISVVDDIGGIMIIALGYTTIRVFTLLSGASIFIVALTLAWAIGRLMYSGKLKMSYYPFVLPGALAVLGLYVASVESVIALTFVVMFIPKAKITHGAFQDEEDPSPLERLELDLKYPVLFVLGAFAFVNMGISVASISVGPLLLAWGGLCLGKPIGIVGGYHLGKKLGFETDLSDHEINLLGFLGGIGLTVSIFIASVTPFDEATQQSFMAGAMLSLPTMLAAASIYMRVFDVKPKTFGDTIVLSESRFEITIEDECCFDEEVIEALAPSYEFLEPEPVSIRLERRQIV